MTSTCGPKVYRESAFPAEYRGNYFVCEAVGNLVHRDVLGGPGPVFNASRGAEGPRVPRLGRPLVQPGLHRDGARWRPVRRGHVPAGDRARRPGRRAGRAERAPGNPPQVRPAGGQHDGPDLPGPAREGERLEEAQAVERRAEAARRDARQPGRLVAHDGPAPDPGASRGRRPRGDRRRRPDGEPRRGGCRPSGRWKGWERSMSS